MSPAPDDGALVLGLDVGGTGSRIGLAPLGGGDREERAGAGVRVGSGGSSVPHLLDTLLDAARDTWPEPMGRVAAVAVGATGLASLVADPAALRHRLTDRLGVPVSLAIDAVTAHLGALGGAGGSVVVLGTGAIAVAHPGPDAAGVLGPHWGRVDGWGHLLGDRGGGAWLGRHGLEAALRAHDGVEPDDAATGRPLLEAATARLGEPAGWPGRLYPREDRAGVLAAVARDVVDLGALGDPASLALLRRAGAEAAASALAALRPDHPARVVLTGGLAAAPALREAFADAVTARRPEVEVRAAAGDPLDGALLLARLTLTRRVRALDGVAWAAPSGSEGTENSENTEQNEKGT